MQFSFVCTTIFSLSLSLSLTHFELRLSTFSMSFSSRYVCLCVAHMSICVCAPFLGHLLCQAIFQINAQIVKPARGRQGEIRVKSRALYRSIVSTKIGSTNCRCCCCKLHTCGMSAHLSSGKKISRGKVKQFAIKSTLNLHSSTWGLYLGYLMTLLSKIYDLPLSTPPPPSLPAINQLPISDRDRSTAFPTQENWRKINL